MSFSKKANIFIGKHVGGISSTLILIYTIWFVSGLVLVDLIDPFLFIGIWMPIGALGAMLCYRW